VILRVRRSLRDDPRVRRAARELGIGPAQGLGHVVALQLWALQHAPDGDLSGLDAADVADAAMWDGAPDTFVSALKAAGLVTEHGRVAEWDRAGGGKAAHVRWHVARARPSDGCPWCVPAAVPRATSCEDHASIMRASCEDDASIMRASCEDHAGITAAPESGQIGQLLALAPSTSDVADISDASRARYKGKGLDLDLDQDLDPSQKQNLTPCDFRAENRLGEEAGGLLASPEDALAVQLADSSALLAAFEAFWKAYPARNGKKLFKAKAREKWRGVRRGEWDAAAVGAKNYADAYARGLPGVGAMDAFRWLRDRHWRDWQTPAVEPARPRTREEEFDSEVAALLEFGRGGADPGFLGAFE